MSLEQYFPGLRAADYQVTSASDVRYNCVAWAAADVARWWEPSPRGYWPPGVQRGLTLEVFIQAFALLGYEPCETDALERGVEKVALFASHGEVTHAARQLPSGRWTSKLGVGVDIEHALRSLEGGIYGEVAQVLSRRKL
jgi:hypothetical protein